MIVMAASQKARLMIISTACSISLDKLMGSAMNWWKT
jgi:hypothetical protein